MDQLDIATIPSFGQEIRDSLFFLDKKVAFTNHGSYGTVPKPLFQAQSALRAQVDAYPDGWYRRKLQPLYLKACEEMAMFIEAPSGSVVLVDNATTAVNIVLNCLTLSKGDGVLITSLTYGACEKAARVICEKTGAKLHILEISLPLDTREAVVELYRQYVDEHPDVRFALIDHITSPSTVLLPVKEIVAVCQARGVRVMVDGAHAPGQLEIRVQDIGADYYTGAHVTVGILFVKVNYNIVTPSRKPAQVAFQPTRLCLAVRQGRISIYCLPTCGITRPFQVCDRLCVT